LKITKSQKTINNQSTKSKQMLSLIFNFGKTSGLTSS